REYMLASRIIVASHMHAGDGNCHVNIPVNSNDPHMMEQAEHVAGRVMAQTQEMGGEVSGEHGIGITKIAFFNKQKMDALREFKERVDPRDILNPAKLVHPELPVRPFTFSFNRLIADVRESGLPDKEKLIRLLSAVQGCTRCGKCKHVCSMTYPERSMQYHPRNKNMVLGMLLEAVYYSQVNKGRIDEALLAHMRAMVEHCTGCGRCTAVCPIKIPSAEVALTLRALLEHEGAGGHPIKSHALTWLVRDVSVRVPKAAKMASLGQKMQNKFLGFVPEVWRRRLQSPLFSGKGPKMGYTNLYESLKLHRGAFFTPAEPAPGMPAVLYFPGCGGALFYDRIGMASILLLLLSLIQG
ncbi:MAG: 4Fe-4S dicluster domain-containing protein, partial [Desulfovibrionaceae bacterium]|nr:4Fe-4S dicluster domain-containing protein [Desulfovibrionaceae bacterium]